MSFAAPTTICDIFLFNENGDIIWKKIGVDALEAQEYFFQPNRPKGSRFVCKTRK